MGKLFRLTARLFGATCLLALLALLGLRAAAALRETAGAQPPANGRQVVTAAGGIFVQSRGPESGPPVVFVAGTAAWSGFWLSIAETTGRAGYRATAIDLPPFGFSERSASGAYSRVDQAERLHALVVALGLKRPTIVGHSFGAGAVVEYAFRYPEEIGAMVLVDAALGLPDDEHPPAADPALLRWALDQPVLAQALTVGDVGECLGHPPVARRAALPKGGGDDRAGRNLDRSVCSRRRHRGLCAMAAQPAVAGNARDQRDARQFR